MGDIGPQSVDEWIALAKRHQEAAHLLKKAKQFSTSWDQSGIAAECYLKAALMAKFRWNRFPDRSRRPELYTHDLGFLLNELGVRLKDMTGEPVGPKLRTMLDWKRAHGYRTGKVPEKFAEALFEAIFKRGGVVEWLTKNYRLPC